MNEILQHMRRFYTIEAVCARHPIFDRKYVKRALNEWGFEKFNLMVEHVMERLTQAEEKARRKSDIEGRV